MHSCQFGQGWELVSSLSPPFQWTIAHCQFWKLLVSFKFISVLVNKWRSPFFSLLICILLVSIKVINTNERNSIISTSGWLAVQSQHHCLREHWEKEVLRLQLEGIFVPSRSTLHRKSCFVVTIYECSELLRSWI